MKKILITGINGFTGRYLSSHLEYGGYDIYGTSSTRINNKNIFQCDITNEQNIIDTLTAIKPDFIIHLAGISFVADDDIVNAYKTNTIGSINILSALSKLNMKPHKIILSSSATVYGNQNRKVLDETLIPKPSGHYFMSKYAVEILAENYFNQLNIIITRPFNYTGAGQSEKFLIPKIVRHFKEKRETIKLGNLEVSREFNNIEYVCEAYKRLLECDAKSEVVNISSNNGIKLLDVISIMNELAGYKIKVEVNPEFVRKDEIQSLTGCTKKLYSIIGKIKQKDLKKTLRDMLEA